MELNICHLYPDILNLYGDRGNIITMKRRLEGRGIKVNIDECSIGQPLNADKYDIFFIGGGQDFEQEVLLRDLASGKAQGHPHRGRGGEDLSRHLRRLPDARRILQDLGRRAARLHRRHRRAHHRREGAHDRQLYVQNHPGERRHASSSASRTTPARPISASRSRRSA